MNSEFGYEVRQGGIAITFAGQPVGECCRDVAEVDAEVLRLQAGLDRVGAQMKRNLAERDEALMFPDKVARRDRGADRA